MCIFKHTHINILLSKCTADDKAKLQEIMVVSNEVSLGLSDLKMVLHAPCKSTTLRQQQHLMIQKVLSKLAFVSVREDARMDARKLRGTGFVVNSLLKAFK